MLKRAVVKCLVDFDRVNCYGGADFDRAVKHGLAHDLAAFLIENARVSIEETPMGKEYAMEVYVEEKGK